MKTEIFDLGPFHFYRCGDGYKETLDISLKAFKDSSWGWEYGWEDDMANHQPLIAIRIGKLQVLYFQKWKKGFELWLLGFWFIV